MANTSIGDIHVLCVDDEVQVLSLLSDTLRAEGYEVQTAVDGTHALQKLALGEPRYDLIIADAYAEP
ncbi:MAG: response regulator [Chthoniobacterales bacterium]|nr:response regulator [Chthoniobacterales bacterium]